MSYTTGCHTIFHHRYHIVWAPKYRFKVLHGEVRLRVRELIRQFSIVSGWDVRQSTAGWMRESFQNPVR